MKKIVLLIVITLMFGACTKYNYIDTGVSKNNEKETMYEYFKQDTYNWSILKSMIDKADLVDIFTGTNPEYKNIMFIAPVDNSIRKWMFDNKFRTIDDVPKELCHKLVMRHVITKAYNRDEVPVGTPGTGDKLVNGGVLLTMDAGNEVWLYSLKVAYMGNPAIIMSTLFCVMRDTGQKGYIATHDLKKSNGIIHSLDDSYQISNFNK